MSKFEKAVNKINETPQWMKEEALLNPIKTYAKKEIIRWLNVKRKALNYLTNGKGDGLPMLDLLITELEYEVQEGKK